ncbi:MAG: hypothetical protein U0931_13185 [Vulcanimicrobiota bacterium]
MRTLIFLLLWVLPAGAQPWLKTRLVVVPGQSVGPIALGKPIPARAYTLLGAAQGSAELNQIPSKDGGGVEWIAGERYLRVKCHDGIKPENVFQIFWTVPNARTADDLGVGSTRAAVLKKYPHGNWTTDTMDGVPTYQTPGLNFSFDYKRGKVIEMHLPARDQR